MRQALVKALLNNESVRVEDLTTMGHPNPEKCDVGFFVWIKGASRSTVEEIARHAE